ncbi:MAG TPA: GTPase Era [Candidatus Avacidaminococcus intestinavium]|uniref:GTPase Era n=1 Tax=Candidatus Avacidaminococcus intestinavium TaxID=2840684 RepID=A0A9D1MP66_9FIRM|nr:GTPase Era [Candidatus Avacidaminococcus intestinavium]
MKEEQKHYSGFVAVVGRPNVGKSTLVNKLIGEKIAIMSDRPQTTRNRIMCILNTEHAQIMFLDTPGIHKPQHKLGKYMVKAAENTLREVDIILFVVDVNEKRGAGDNYVIEQLKKTKTPVILVANKIDKLTDKKQLLPIIADYMAQYSFAEVIPVSALVDMSFEQLVGSIVKRLPEGPQYFPEDMITDQPERVIAAELVREKVLHLTRDEIPHSIAVEVEEMKTRENEDLFVRAVIYVERDSQKGIVIGNKGSLLKQVGQEARKDLEALLGNKVYLDLWVKVKSDWRNKDTALRQFGYNN